MYCWPCCSIWFGDLADEMQLQMQGIPGWDGFAQAGGMVHIRFKGSSSSLFVVDSR